MFRPLLQSCLKEREVLFGGQHSFGLAKLDISSEFTARPSTEVAAVLEALGTAYHSTGNNNLATIKLERAVGILSLLPEPTAAQNTHARHGHGLLARAHETLATIHKAEGRLEAAAADAKESLSIRRIIHGPVPPIAPPPLCNAKMWRKLIFTCSPGTGPSNTRK